MSSRSTPPKPLMPVTCETCGVTPMPVVASGRLALWCPCCRSADRERAVYVKAESRMPDEWRALYANPDAAVQTLAPGEVEQTTDEEDSNDDN